MLVTGRNEVVAKVMFLQASVILSTGGCLPQCMLEYTPPRSRHPPGTRPLLEQTPPGSRHPHPKKEAGSGIRSMSGRYASYWNAFLLFRYFSPSPIVQIHFLTPFVVLAAATALTRPSNMCLWQVWEVPSGGD